MVIIEKIESLRTWLVKKLTPMCDADPNALAKYVVALIKKDKSEEELRKLCIDQLEVFLQKETNNFVAELFSALKSKAYFEDQNDLTSNPNEVQDIAELKEQKKPIKRKLQRPAPIRHRSRSPYDRRRRSKRSRSPRERRSRRYRSHSGSPKRSRISPKRKSPIRRSRTRSRSPYRRGGRTGSLSSSRSSSRSPDSSHPKASLSDDRSTGKKKRCWDYDQKGFCVLGDNCPYDHGKDPVVVDDAAITSTSRPPSKITPITAPPPIVPPVKPVVPPPVLPPPPFLPPPPMGFPVPPPVLRPPIPPPIPPPPPGTLRVPPPRLPPPPRSHPPPGYNPEAPALTYPERRQNLTNLVPVSSTTQILGIGGPIRTLQIRGPVQGGAVKQTAYNNIPPGVQNTGNSNNFSSNAKLVIRKIPPILNNITKLNEHFSKFGAINNIQVKFENDPQCALIEYAHVNSARAAKRDTGAVMNNRFIMVHWYNPQASNGKPQQLSRPSVKERLGVLPTPSQLKYTAPGKEPNPKAQNESVVAAGTIYRTISNPNASVPPVVKPQESESPKDKIETKLKVQQAQKAANEKFLARQKIVMQKKIELQKQKRELLQAQMQQQKAFLDKIKMAKNMPASEKLQLLESLKSLTASIDKLRTSLKGEDIHAPQTEAKEKQKQAQKELLDAELDLYNASTTGENTINLKRKLNQLKVEASSLGLVTAYKSGWGAARGRGRGGFIHRPKAPRVFSASANLDRRPRELRVTGFHDDEKDELISHLARFGEIDKFSFGDDEITCTVKFQTRAQAELASLHGPTFKNRRLIIVWTSGSAPPVVPTSTPAAETTPDSAEDTPQEDETLVVSPNNKEEKGNEEEDEEADTVNVHIGDVTVNYPGDLEEDEDAYEDELDEDALLAADYDEDDEQIGDVDEEYDEEIRSWRR